MRPWAADLAARGYTVSVPRLPGHGTHWRELAITTWHDWYQAVEAEYLWLAERTEKVFVTGLSMGGALALRLAEHHDVAGLVLVNPAIAADDISFKFLPVLSKFIPSINAIGNDTKREGTDERAYPRTPLKAAASMVQMWGDITANLDRITAPVLLFTSREDHVVDKATGRLLDEKIDLLDHRWLENSYHVATLDNDAERIFNESASFFELVARR